MATTSLIPTPSTAVAERPERAYTNLEQALWSKTFAKDLAHFLGSPEAAASLIAEIFNQARRIPNLHHCTRSSIQLNVARVASLRLNPALPNMVHFIPREMKQPKANPSDPDKYALELTLQYGYAGLRELVMRSPEVKDCFTQAVCANDHFSPPPTLTGPPEHRLPPGFQPRGRVIGYFATIQLHNGNWRWWPMSVAEIETHVHRYIKDPGPAWTRAARPDDEGLTPRDKMSMKTCLRMLCNGRDVPMTSEARIALDAERDVELQPTAAERQGYTRQGERAALTMSTGLPLDDLLQDISGTQDKASVAMQMEETVRSPARAGRRRAADPLPKPDTGAAGTNGAWRENVATLAATLPDALSDRAPAALVTQVHETCQRALQLVEQADTPASTGEAMLETLRTLRAEVGAQLSFEEYGN